MAILSWSSCLRCLVLSCSGRPVISFLSRLFSMVFCSQCPLQLFLLSSSVLSLLSGSDRPIYFPAVLSRTTDFCFYVSPPSLTLFCPGWPVRPICSALTRPGSTVLSCLGSSVLVVLSQRSCPTMFWFPVGRVFPVVNVLQHFPSST